jgi:hypothetical protein
MQINYNTDDPKYKAEAQKSYNYFLDHVGESMAEADKLQKENGEALPICYAVEGGPVTYMDLHDGGFLSYGARLGGHDPEALYINDQWAIIELSGGGPASRLVIKHELDNTQQDQVWIYNIYYQYQEWFRDWLNVYVSIQDRDLIKEWLFNYVDITLPGTLGDYFSTSNNQVNILNY